MLGTLAHQVRKVVLLAHRLDPRLPRGDTVAQLQLPLLVVLDLEAPLQLSDVGGVFLGVDAKVLAETAPNARLFRDLGTLLLGNFSREPSAISVQVLNGLSHGRNGGRFLLARGRPGVGRGCLGDGWRVG